MILKSSLQKSANILTKRKIKKLKEESADYLAESEQNHD